MFAGNGDLAESLTRSCRVTQFSRQVVHQFRELVRQIMELAANFPEFETSPAGRPGGTDRHR